MTKKKEEPKKDKKDSKEKEEKSLEQEGNEIINKLLSKEKQDAFKSLLGKSVAQDIMIRKIKYQAALAAEFSEEQAFEYCMRDLNKK